MNSESDSQTDVEPNVQTLQACLFPTQLTTSNSYFSNFFVKPITFDDDEDPKFRLKECISFRDTSINKEVPFTLQQPRWPTECQVLDERIKHISYIPSTFEPYYQTTGNEVQPKPSGEECGVIVYQYIPISAVNYFSRSSLGGSRYLLSTDMCPEEDTLKFESRFECGNLATAIRISPSYYELHLRADMYTSRHMQWFYFRVTNMRKGFKYRFSITNCSKENSLYNEGMRPLMYSTKDSQLHSIGWRRIGHNITYFCNENVSPEDPDQQMTYTLSFTLEFPHDDDEVYLANCYPYTYSDLQDYLMELSSHPIKSAFSTVRLLCKSLAGNNIYFVTITSPLLPGDTRKKKAVVITARVHPGETPASWMVKGCLDFLTSDSNAAKELRDRFVFKIVPMLNPDGVIVGNSRCSLSSKDLNRQYRTVMRDAYPSIWYTKLMVRRLLEECGVAMYCDFHAHSRKHNIFVYGCENRRCGERKLQEQVFPLMLHKNTADKFSFESCKFRIQKAKEGTGRVVMWMMGIANSYTMEASFAGSSIGNRNDTHFTIQDYEQMGKSFCQTLLDYYDEDPRKERLRIKIIERLTKEGSNADEPTNIPLSDYSSDEGDTSSSTDEEETEREVPEVLPVPPPPSPAVLIKKTKCKSSQTKAKLVLTKSTNNAPSRKPLPICKATLKLSLSEKENLESSSDSENDFEKLTIENIEKVSLFRRKRRKKKYGRKKRQMPIQEYSDSEIHTIRKTLTQRSLSVFDLIPSDEIVTQSSRNAPKPKVTNGRKSEVTRQLAEVQAKLFTLKNKLWFGVSGGDAPISWVSESIFTSRTTTQRVSRKMSKKEGKKHEKTEKNNNKIEQETINKNQNNLKRQTAIDWSIAVEPLRLGRSRSLPDEAAIKKNAAAKNKGNNKEEKQEKKKKKRSKRFAKKAKVVGNAKTFTQKV